MSRYWCLQNFALVHTETLDRSVTKVTEGITRGMSKLTFDTEYQNQMASREKAQNVGTFVVF